MFRAAVQAEAVHDGEAVALVAVQVDRYQAIIARLAGNSVQAKTWCFTATAAVAALGIGNKHSAGIFAVCLVLLAAFFYLDAYYLTLEQHFREASTTLSRKVALGEQVSRP